jgi:hypothetical protein
MRAYNIRKTMLYSQKTRLQVFYSFAIRNTRSQRPRARLQVANTVKSDRPLKNLVLASYTDTTNRRSVYCDYSSLLLESAGGEALPAIRMVVVGFLSSSQPIIALCDSDNRILQRSLRERQ